MGGQYLVLNVHQGRFVDLQNGILLLDLSFLEHKDILVLLVQLMIVTTVPGRLVNVWLVQMGGIISIEGILTQLLTCVYWSIRTKYRVRNP